MSSGHFDFGNSDFAKDTDRLQAPSRTPKNHKYSFQLNNNEEAYPSFPTNQSSNFSQSNHPGSQY
jgi:hypothetical protein